MTEMIRQINLDMDGTFVDLYGVDGWLEMLINHDETPYRVAKPLVRLNQLARALNKAQSKGYKICVISWLAKNSNVEYDEKVTKAKTEWLSKHLASVKFDEINIVKYGTPKETVGKGILFDDEEPNRNNWVGEAYNVENLIRQIRKIVG